MTRFGFSLPTFALTVIAIGCGTPGHDVTDDEIASRGLAVHTACATSSTTTPGIDVSSWQTEIDWAQVAQDGKVFAFIRVSHGTGTIDAYFEDNWAGAKQHGIIRGVYQYWEPAEDPIAQADVLIDKINAAGGLEPGDLPPVIDIETLENATAAQAIANAATWIERVESALQRKVIVYTGSYFWDDHDLGPSLSDHPLWGPNYTSNPCPLISDAWEQWTFWQYSSTGSVSGISGNVDLNWFDGSVDDLQQFIEDTNLAPPEPDAGPIDDAEAEASLPEATVDAPGSYDADPPDSQDTDGGTGSARTWAPGEEASGCACRTAAARTASGSTMFALLGIVGMLIAGWARRHRRASGHDRSPSFRKNART